ncbi:MAG: hypothetical protein AAGA09_03200 [Pseudomonadota bacterium]
MRLLSTALFCGLLVALSGDALAASSNTPRDIWSKPPLELLNRDILALPKAEQQAFIHGAVGQFILSFSTGGRTGGRCLSDWYLDTEHGRTHLPTWMARYPEREFAVTLHAVAKQYCPQITK